MFPSVNVTHSSSLTITPPLLSHIPSKHPYPLHTSTPPPHFHTPSRLQKINKKLAAEKDDLMAQLSSTTSALTAHQSKAVQEATDLNKKLKAAEAKAKQLELVAKALAEAERERDLLRDKVWS